MILGGFVCLAAASVLELLSDSILQSRLIAAQQNFAIQSLEQATDSIAKLAIALQTANEIAITGVQKNEAFAAKADVARDRTNQLLVW